MQALTAVYEAYQPFIIGFAAFCALGFAYELLTDK